MSKYDDLFAETAPGDSVSAEKRALDPLASPEEIRGRETQERQLANILNGVHEGYLPPTVAIHGPPGTGKTTTTRRCAESSPIGPTTSPSSILISRTLKPGGAE